MNLNTETALPAERETVLRFFERLQKTYPSMQNFYRREEEGDFVFEEDKDKGSYRWCTIERHRVCSGHVNPETIEAAMEQHRLVLELAPQMLSVSPLDCESLDSLYGFDFTYHGNHGQLVAEALGVCPAMQWMTDIPDSRMIDHQPSLTITLDQDCRVQFRLSLETRTNAYQIRTGDFPEEQLSVYVAARQYGSLGRDGTFVEALQRLGEVCHEMIENHVAEHVLNPLARIVAGA